MGKSIPVSPISYLPSTSVLVCELLTKAILEHIDATGMTSAQITAKYPTFRGGYLAEMRNGVRFGERRLFAMCEAIGLFPVVTFYGSQREQKREQLRLMEAA